MSVGEPYQGCFKFQSDSINTDNSMILSDATIFFKFQSDSINTEEDRGVLMTLEGFKFQSDSINTSRILLLLNITL